MSYMALYRKFRPTGFQDVKGQEHIVTTLKNQIKAERVGHAYLFCGTRGTGKTTVAKIFAKAVNCEHPIEGSPCGECPTCKAIAEGFSRNVIEIDAASNNGVDNIREIREEVSYSPTEGKYKVYIIDEVHMLSIGAFNALLKTLEEPPSYVIFILATTEAHKIPITILSRCQQYDFHRISIETMVGRMQELMEIEKSEVEERALRYIAKAADGSMRDALSLLDQCMAFFMGETLTYEKVLYVLGAVDAEVFSDLFKKIRAQDVNGVIRLIDELIMQGREMGQFVVDFTWYLRNLLLVKSSDQMEDVLDMSTENLAIMKEEVREISAGILMRYIRIFSELSGQIKYSTQKRTLIEIACIKLCKPQMEQNYDALIDRIAQLEHKLDTGQFKSSKSMLGEAEEPVKKPQMPKAIPQDVRDVVQKWTSITSSMSKLMGGYLKKARPSVGEDNRLIIVFSDAVGAGIFSEESHKKELEEIISQAIGKQIDVKIQAIENGHKFEEEFIDLEQLIHMDLTIEEE
ncbi:MAG: DNA polymerase III subunit gamma/tau [Lachnospiraceae bacterium]